MYLTHFSNHNTRTIQWGHPYLHITQHALCSNYWFPIQMFCPTYSQTCNIHVQLFSLLSPCESLLEPLERDVHVCVSEAMAQRSTEEVLRLRVYILCKRQTWKKNFDFSTCKLLKTNFPSTISGFTNIFYVFLYLKFPSTSNSLFIHNARYCTVLTCVSFCPTSVGGGQDLSVNKGVLYQARPKIQVKRVFFFKSSTVRA